MNKTKLSRDVINTNLSTRKSEKDASTPIYKDESNNLVEITINDIGKAAFSYGSIYPYLTNGLSTLCTNNPTATNDKNEECFVIRNQDNNEETHFSARLKWDTLVTLCTDNEPTSRDLFRHEILKLFNNAPNMYVKLGNGYSVLTHPFIIKNIWYADYTKMTKEQAEKCSRIGIDKVILFVDIDFFKPLFYACFPNSKYKHNGFIYTDNAIYAKLVKTIETIRKDPIVSKEYLKYYNRRTKQYIQKHAVTYYKFILYFLAHLTNNKSATSIKIDMVKMLSEVDPGQLCEKNGKLYCKNAYDTKLFCEKAGKIYVQMAKYGYCEHTEAVITNCIYHSDNTMTINFQRTIPRTNINDYSSNLTNEIGQNKPLEIEIQPKQL